MGKHDEERQRESVVCHRRRHIEPVERRNQCNGGDPAAARRAESNMAAAQEALRARREAAREQAAASGGGAADQEREMSDWYRNHRPSSLTRASEVASLMDAEAPAAARWSAAAASPPGCGRFSGSLKIIRANYQKGK